MQARWRRNQSEIRDLETKVDNAEKRLTKNANEMASDIATNNTNFTVLQEQLNKQITMYNDVTAYIKALDKQDSAFTRELGDVQAKLLAIDQVNSAISRRIAAMEKWQQQVKNTPPPAQTQRVNKEPPTGLPTQTQ